MKDIQLGYEHQISPVKIIKVEQRTHWFSWSGTFWIISFSKTTHHMLSLKSLPSTGIISFSSFYQASSAFSYIQTETSWSTKSTDCTVSPQSTTFDYCSYHLETSPHMTTGLTPHPSAGAQNRPGQSLPLRRLQSGGPAGKQASLPIAIRSLRSGLSNLT